MAAARVTVPKVKRPDPETTAQAATWDRNASRYRALGFCDRDAAAAAWGHQLGFSNVAPIRDCCRGRHVPAERGQRVARWVAGATE